MAKIIILGGGESGVGAAVLASLKGHSVFLSDFNMLTNEAKVVLEEYKVDYEEGKHTREKILKADEVIKSPGIPDSVPIMCDIIAENIPVISEIEFAGRYDNSKKICVTGSNGKTTTTSILYFLMKNAGLNVGLAGNIGKSYAYQVATQNYDYYVLELSSFQLDGMYEFKADIAVLLNITPDHLDRYDNSMESYIKAKFRITRNMSSDEFFIFCADDDITVSTLDKIIIKAKQLPFTQNSPLPQGAFLKDNNIEVAVNDDTFSMPLGDLSLKGRHNVYNSMAAAITGKILNISNSDIRESLMGFKGIEHRLESVLKIKNVLYINDSKATNVNSTWYALESIKGDIIWIAGGEDKGNDYTPLMELVKSKVRVLICMGVDNRKLIAQFKDSVEEIYDTKSVIEAVEIAYNCAKSGETVLLSPACASFDLFKNYEDRGLKFKEAVASL